MKIVFVSIYPEKDKKHTNTSGVAYYLKDLVNNIPFKKNDEIYVFCNKLKGKAEEYKEGEINIIRCFDKNPFFIFQLLRQVIKRNPDIIHIQQELSLFGGIITAFLLQWFLLFLRILRKQIIITLHGVVSLKSIDKEFVIANNSNFPPFLVKLAFFIIYKPLCILATGIIVHEEYFRNILIEEYFVKAGKVEVVNLGIEKLNLLDKRYAQKKLMLPLNKHTVLYMGYLTGYKGLDLLIEGFSQFVKKEKNSFLILGAGKHPRLSENKEYLREYKRIETKAKKMIPGSNYRWVGFIDEKEIPLYFSACDLVVFPYTICMSSSGPMALSLSYGREFIASEVFDMVIYNKNILFKRTPQDLNRILTEFFRDSSKFKISAGIRKNKDWKSIGKKTYSLYK